MTGCSVGPEMMRLAQEHNAPAQVCAEKTLEQCAEMLEEHDAAMAGMLGSEMMRIEYRQRAAGVVQVRWRGVWGVEVSG